MWSMPKVVFHHRLAKEHNSEFTLVAIWTQITAVFGALIPSFLLEDADEDSGGQIKLL